MTEGGGKEKSFNSSCQVKTSMDIRCSGTAAAKEPASGEGEAKEQASREGEPLLRVLLEFQGIFVFTAEVDSSLAKQKEFESCYMMISWQ